MKFMKAALISLAMTALLAAAAFAGETLMMATTTSTANTGLLDELIVPKFQKDTGVELKFVAVGTGKALKMAENCDVDVVLVHAPAAEQKYVDAGVLMDRKELMYNDFVIIGPASDPAKVKGMKVVEAMKTIAAAKAAFASRGTTPAPTRRKSPFGRPPEWLSPTRPNGTCRPVRACCPPSPWPTKRAPTP